MSETVQPATVTSIPPSQAPTRAAATRVPPTVTPQPAYTVKTILPPMTRQTLGKVNLRQGPGTAYALAGAVSENSMLQIIGESGDWYQISLNGQEVFIASWLTYDLPTAAPTAVPASNSATNVRRFASPQRKYTHGQVNLRSGPGTTFGKIGAVAAGTNLQVLGQSGDWYLINHNGRDAFIANWLTYDSPLQAASRQQPAQQQPVQQQPVQQQPVQQQPVQQQPVQQQPVQQQPVQQQPVQQQPAQTNFSCSTKKNCGDMSSCDEARFHLTQCGRSGLDRDKDGVPCESICPGG